VSPFWWIVWIAVLVELGTWAVVLWRIAIRDLARPIPFPPDGDCGEAVAMRAFDLNEAVDFREGGTDA